MAHLPLTFTSATRLDGLHQALSSLPFEIAFPFIEKIHSFSIADALPSEEHPDQQVPGWPEPSSTCDCTATHLARTQFP